MVPDMKAMPATRACHFWLICQSCLGNWDGQGQGGGKTNRDDC